MTKDNEREVLVALQSGPQRMKDVKFSKHLATLYRTLKILQAKGWVEAIEDRNYALTSLGRRALELLHV